MAIISCPSCGQKVSDKAPSCPKCGMGIAELDQEKLAAMARDRRLNQSQSLMTQSMIAMILFLAGFFFYWQLPPYGWQYYAAIAAIGVGFIWYLVNRVRILMLKRKSKHGL
ncbi:zinc ribbon domain-containing protein [Alkalimonas delamerensis]|uniref:Zinc ribbon domain-containing protein n=1 Tax=Alkalimonas delamerensis TaxID=265981 RepID=A0ABT9GNP5_9GAMM|nr:zinc ribbon domain-containing protein [Alkalimonas delamerensis]MDP4528589.1 zinc ribbon domain-containing protein [Alkalimonas delamerensis]